MILIVSHVCERISQHISTVMLRGTNIDYISIYAVVMVTMIEIIGMVTIATNSYFCHDDHDTSNKSIPRL